MCWSASTRSCRPPRPSTPPTAPSTTRRWSLQRGDGRSVRRARVDVHKRALGHLLTRVPRRGFCELRLNGVLRSSHLDSPKRLKKATLSLQCFTENSSSSFILGVL